MNKANKTTKKNNNLEAPSDHDDALKKQASNQTQSVHTRRLGKNSLLSEKLNVKAGKSSSVKQRCPAGVTDQSIPPSFYNSRASTSHAHTRLHHEERRRKVTTAPRCDLSSGSNASHNAGPRKRNARGE